MRIHKINAQRNSQTRHPQKYSCLANLVKRSGEEGYLY